MKRHLVGLAAWPLAIAVLFGPGGLGASAQSLSTEDEQTLHSAGLGGDGPTILAFLQARARTSVDGEALEQLLRQLAAPAKADHEQAAARLLGLGPLALPLLRQAANDLDRPELAVRATRCLPWLDGPSSVRLLAAAARALAVRKPAGAAAALLTFLPLTDNPEVIGAVQNALAAVASADGKPDAALVRGLGDAAGVRRAAAGVALCRAEPARAAPAVRNLLKDPVPAVRLRAALALAESGDAEAVPVLIDLLSDLSADERRPIEEQLGQLAGEWTPVLEFARDDEVSRRIRRDAWASWWRHTDGAFLVSTLGKHTLTADKRDRARRFLSELRSDEFTVRENAADELTRLGRVALPQLREANKDRDPEVARRTAAIIERIEHEPAQQLPIAALRLLAVRKPTGALEALLAYLPNAEEDERSEDVRQALARLALAGGKIDPALKEALADTRPLVRATAARALVEGAGADGRALARKHLTDEAPVVRLHVALALAHAKEREAMPVLIDLVTVLPGEQREQVEEALHTVAGDSVPEMPGGDGAAELKKRRDAWAAWWKANGEKTDLARLTDHAVLGFTLICDVGANRVFEIDRHGKERWSIDGVQQPFDAVVLPGKRVLIAEFSANRVTERDFKGKVLWEKRVPNNPSNCQRLANGNTLITMNGGPIMEVDRSGKVIYTIPNVPGNILSAQRSRRGDIYCMTFNGQTVRLDTSGKELANYATGHDANSMGGIDLAPNGHVLVAWQQVGKMIELDREGKKLLELEVAGLRTVSALANGHFLAACQATQRVCEVDRAGKVLWEHKMTGNPFRARRR